MLTQAVLHVILIFIFSALPAPKGVMQQIKSIQQDFLWGRGEEKKKCTLVAWENIFKPKIHGILGLYDLETLRKVSRAKL